MDHHMKNWAEACNQLSIKLTAKAAITHIAVYHVELDTAEVLINSNPQPERISFTSEAFVNALCDWVISDDQVFLFLFAVLTDFS